MPQTNPDLTGIFGALSDPTRRQILAQLTRGDAYVTELAEPYDMSLAAISRHLHVLADAGLMTRTKEGRSIRCHLNAAPLRGIVDWLADYSRFWDQKLDALVYRL